MISGIIGGLQLGDEMPVRIMGVINLTKDSFYSESYCKTDKEIKSTATAMVRDGADLIDLGARSTAPYKKQDVSVESEKRQLVRALRVLQRCIDVPISVDTTRYEPAKAAFEEGATILNDVYGFTQKESSRLAELVASKDASLLSAAHEASQGHTHNPIARVLSSLEKSLKFAQSHCIDKKRITLDPGIGFFSDEQISNLGWNSAIISDLRKIRVLERPIAIGISRKRFIGTILGKDSPTDRLYGTLGATAVAVSKGAHLVRTHDVLPTVELVRVVSSFREKRFNPRRD